MNNWTDLVVSLAVAAVPIIGVWLSKQLLANKQVLTLLKVLGPLANAAVTLAEQLGVTQTIDGAVKKSTAIQAVKDGLKSLGFTSVDERTIANAVESAYAQLKADGTLDAYPQATKPDDKQEEIAKAEAELAKLKEQEAAAQKQLDALKGAQN
ncbi:phage holin [Limosilactobacillus fermentum]|uniref:phage holin n=1 Tax=Limosilactobacillus fermentum TaxID=1613 RepID=UPI0030B9F28D